MNMLILSQASCDGTTKQGLFREYSDLETYETMWEKYIFNPAYIQVSKKV